MFACEGYGVGDLFQNNLEGGKVSMIGLDTE